MSFNNSNSTESDKKKKGLIIPLISFSIICISNIIMYSYLPEIMYLNPSSKGMPVQKEIFLLITPITSVILNFLNFKFNTNNSLNINIINIFLPIMSIASNYFSV